MQYLRLWESSLSQTIMYYANKFDEPRYLEHDSEYESYQELVCGLY